MAKDPRCRGDDLPPGACPACSSASTLGPPGLHAGGAMGCLGCGASWQETPDGGTDGPWYCPHGQAVATPGGACYRCAEEDAYEDPGDQR